MPRITYEKPAERLALGRNGYSYQHGLELWGGEDEVELMPVNSKGGTTRARLVVPKADIPALIEELKRHV